MNNLDGASGCWPGGGGAGALRWHFHREEDGTALRTAVQLHPLNHGAIVAPSKLIRVASRTPMHGSRAAILKS